MEGFELVSKPRKSELHRKKGKSEKESGGFDYEKPKRRLGKKINIKEKGVVLKGKIAEGSTMEELSELKKGLEAEKVKELEKKIEGILHQRMHSKSEPSIWIQFSKNSEGKFIVYAGHKDEDVSKDGDLVDLNKPEEIEKIEKDLGVFVVPNEELKNWADKLGREKDKDESGEKRKLNDEQEKFLAELKNKTEVAALKELERTEKKSKSETAAEKQARINLREISERGKIREDEINKVFNSGLHKKFLEKKRLTKGDISEINERTSNLSRESDFLLEIKDEYGEHKKEVEAENERLKRVIGRRRTWLQEISEKHNQQIEKAVAKKINVAVKKPTIIKRKGLDESGDRIRIVLPANNGSANDEAEEFAQGVIENEKRKEELKKEKEKTPEDQGDLFENQKLENKKAEIEKTEKAAEQKEFPKEDQLDLFTVGAENKGKLEQLRGEVEYARKEYAETDYGKNKAYKRIYKLLFNWSEDKKRIEDQDIAYYRAHYDNKLFNYKNALIEDARARAVSNEELGEIVRLFELEGRLNMADAHTQVKFENQDGKFLGFVKNHGKEMADWYNDLSLKKKIAIGAAFGLAAAGSVFAGAAAAGAVASAATMRRVFTGVVTGTTLSLALESSGREKTKKNIEKNTQSFVEQLNELPIEERAKLVEKKIKELVFYGDDELQKIKNKNLFQMSAGALAGSVVGSGILSDVIGKGWHGAAEYFGISSEISTGGGADRPIGVIKSYGPTVENNLGIDSPKIPSVAPLESEDVIAPKPVDISDSYFIKGDQIPRSLSSEELRGAGNALEYIRETGVNDAVEAVEKVGRSELTGKLDEILTSVDSQSREVFGKWSVAADAADAHEFLVQKHDLDFMKGFLESFKNSVLSGNEESSTQSIQKIISTGKNWEDIKGIKFWEAANKFGWRSSPRLINIFTSLNEIAGTEVRPGTQETLESWTKRVAAIAMEKAGQ